MQQKSINDALRAFEADEANLAKLESLWKEIRDMIPDELVFGDTTDGVYDDRCRAFRDIHNCLPKIDGWSMDICLMDLNEIGQIRFDSLELGMIECTVSTEDHIYSQDRHLKEYRYKLNRKRRQLVRENLLDAIDRIDSSIRILHLSYPDGFSPTNSDVEGNEWDMLKKSVSEIDVLLGSSMKRPPRWNDLRKHVHFGMVQDLLDIRRFDWPSVKIGISDGLYDATDPIPVGVDDLGVLVDTKPSGKVVTKLKWETLDESGFERLVFSLISHAEGYENPEWLTKTNATDRGRDLSVMRVITDILGGTTRQRVIIQCKHWLSRSVGLSDISTTKEQMALWTQPPVDILIIVTSGRFSTDAIQYTETINQGAGRLRIETWAESHLEKLLASRPALIAEFGLR